MQINLPALSGITGGATGMILVASSDTTQILIVPNGADKITFQGTTDNDSIENTGAAGEFLWLIPMSSTVGWLVVAGYDLANFAFTGP